MQKNSHDSINRKDFLHRSTTGLIGAGIVGFAAPAFIPNARAAVHLESRDIGKTGLRAVAVGLGGSRTSEPSIVRRAVSMGANFIDTGRMYSGGRNEEMIGKVIKDVRKNIIIQSKMDQKIQRDAAAMEKSIDDSLKALQTDYIDIMIIRGASDEKAINNLIVRGAFEKAKKAGKIRFCGFSSHSPQSHDILRLGIDAGWYDVAMVPYNHAGNFTHTVYGIYSEWDQAALEKQFERAAQKGIGIICMKTCSAGPLKKEREPRGTFGAGLKWILRNKNISVMAVGMGSFREVEEDLGVMG